MPRLVLNTFGSLGDLHPFLAIAMELQKRGHSTTIATSEVYRKKIEDENVGFAPVRPDVGEMLNNLEQLSKFWHPTRGTEYLIRDYLAPSIEQSYQDLAQASQGADLLLTHVAGYAGPIVAEARRLPWISVVLQPSIFLSVYDPPILPATWLRHLYPLGRSVISGLFALGRARARSWIKPVLRLRSRLGLANRANPVFEGQFSPYGTLALFSKHFVQPQRDWPPNIAITGFIFYDQLGAGFTEYTSGTQATVLRELEEFLRSGPPPVLFTLGSSAVMRPGSFFEQSVQAAQNLGIRAVLLTGNQPAPKLSGDLAKSMFVAGYAPYSQLMSEAALTVHQGGIGTTAQALRAGKPMLIVPWAHDQPDNAERARKLGVARTLERARYTAAAAGLEIEQLIDNPTYAQAALMFRDRLVIEDGLTAACDRIEATLGTQVF